VVAQANNVPVSVVVRDHNGCVIRGLPSQHLAGHADAGACPGGPDRQATGAAHCGAGLFRFLDAGQLPLPLAARVLEETMKFPDREAQADAMASLAEATGGLYFRNNNGLTLGFERLELAPADEYEMALVPMPLVRNGALHQHQITIVPPIAAAKTSARPWSPRRSTPRGL
jgi:hypothetical protein